MFPLPQRETAPPPSALVPQPGVLLLLSAPGRREKREKQWKKTKVKRKGNYGLCISERDGKTWLVLLSSTMERQRSLAEKDLGWRPSNTFIEKHSTMAFPSETRRVLGKLNAEYPAFCQDGCWNPCLHAFTLCFTKRVPSNRKYS